MQKETFEKAIEITNELASLRKHKEELLNSQILNGGDLVFTYNCHYKDVGLIGDLYGGNEFFKKYMENLNAKIQGLEEEFEKL